MASRAKKKKSARQSFLGADTDRIFQTCVVGIVGLGGGGSHIVQQLAHIGFENFVLYDPDIVEETNLNRLVGATMQDVRDERPKVEIASRVIKGLEESANITPMQKRWQDEPGPLRSCDILFGCVDGFRERQQLEVSARRFMIPFIDIGMDVHTADGHSPQVDGQVILSMPGEPCMTCMGFLNESSLAKEAGKYGDAGDMPQVVWPNGVLASTAVGIAVNLLTDWSGALRAPVYLSYRGNLGIIQPHVRLEYVSGTPCSHFSSTNVGEPVFKAM